MGTKEKKVSLSTFIIVILLVIISMSAGFYCFHKYEIENLKREKNDENQIASENIDTENAKDDSYIFLYDGYEIEKKVGLQKMPVYMEATDDNKSKYEINYYTYDKEGELSEVKGIFKSDEAYEGYGYISNLKKVASSLKYEVMPRTPSILNDYENIEAFNEFKGISDVKVEAIDLDGDENLEYIVSLNNFSSKEEYEIEESEAFSQIILYDSNYKAIGNLVTWNNVTEENDKNNYISLDNIMYADIDNDGIMEIIIEVLEYESGLISVYKYDEGKIDGEVDYKVDINP